MAAKQVQSVVLMSAPYLKSRRYAAVLLSLVSGEGSGECCPAAPCAQASDQTGAACARASAWSHRRHLTLEQMPALPPKVRFSNGLLTIVAENSTLADILRAVRTQTGAVVEIPANATERVVTHLGPGPPRDVLVSLLHGSHFNYVMLGSPTRPGMLDRIILTSKAGVGSEASSAAVPGAQNAAAAAAAAVEDPEPPGVDISEQPAEDGADNSANEENQQSNGQPPPIKTPEQLLRELQQQQQQLQQQGSHSRRKRSSRDAPAQVDSGNMWRGRPFDFAQGRLSPAVLTLVFRIISPRKKTLRWRQGRGSF